MKKLLRLISLSTLFLGISINLSAQQKIILNDQAAGSIPEIKVLETTEKSYKLNIKIPVYYRSKELANSDEFDNIKIELFSELSDPGKPNLPVFGQMLAVPNHARIEIEVEPIDVVEIENIYLMPAFQPLAESDVHAKFTMDEQIYNADLFYPKNLSWSEEIKIIRGCPVSLIWISPVQFNPVQRKARFYEEFNVTVKFAGGDGFSLPGKSFSPYFKSVFERNLKNWTTVKKHLKVNTIEQQNEYDFFSGCDYLIITNRKFSEAADSLAGWRRVCGFKTKIAYSDEIGSSASKIRDYIRYAYFNWHPAPSFVVFLGDAEFVPTNYFTNHSNETNGMIGTDLYYAAVDGADYFPDIITGRIPVDTQLEAFAFVNKIIKYEKEPITDSNFYQRAITAAYFQDDDDPDTQNYNERDGYEDRRFVLTNEEIRDFLMKLGYTVDRVYFAEPEVTPTNYNNSGYASGEPLPEELLRANGFYWSGNASNISSLIQDGCFLVSHRDHGSRVGWGEPSYKIPEVKSLFNKSKLPVIMSTNCETGWFDNETDDVSTNTGTTAECFVEYWIRNFNGGAIGVLGSTRISYSGYNDALAKGFIDGIFPEFLSYNLTGQPIYYLGQALNYAKFYMAQEYGSNTTRKIEFEEFHFYGDPATQIRTQAPGEFFVQSIDSCFLNQRSLVINVGVQGAIITLLQVDRILSSVFTDESGIAELNFAPIQSHDELVFAVTKANYKPYITRIKVYSSTLNKLIVNSPYIIEQNGDNRINIGEAINWLIEIENKGMIDFLNIGLQLICADSLVEFLMPTAAIDTLKINEEIIASELAFRISGACPDAHFVNMDLQILNNGDTLVIPLDFTVFAALPRIAVSPQMIGEIITAKNDSLLKYLTITNTGFGELAVDIQDESKFSLSVGDTSLNWWANTALGTGNVFLVNQPSNLLRFSFYLKLTSPVDAHFFVYEGDQIVGSYQKIADVEKKLDKIGEFYFGTDILNLSLKAGKYYYFGISWANGEANICRSNESPPIEYPFGMLETGVVNIGGVPPADLIEQTFQRVITFVQTLELGAGTWLELPKTTNLLLPGKSEQFPVKLKSLDQDTTVFSKILLISNDVENDSLRVPVYLSTGNDSFNLILSLAEIIDNNGGNNDHQINPGEFVTLPIVIKNIGIDTLKNVTFKINTVDTMIQFLANYDSLAILNPGEELTIPAFNLTASLRCPARHIFSIKITSTMSDFDERNFDFELQIKEAEPKIAVLQDSISGTIALLNDSLFSDITISNLGFGKLIFELNNPVQQVVAMGTPSNRVWLPLANGVGNIFNQIITQKIQSFSSYFQVNSSGTIYFFIYEADSSCGEFKLKFANSIYVEETGERCVTVPVLGCDLLKNHFYYIGSSWNGEMKILKAVEGLPFQSSSNIVFASTFNKGGVPPDEIVEITTQSPLLIAQRFNFGIGDWIELSAKADTLFPGESKQAAIKLIATRSDTNLFTNISIISTDPVNKRINVPVHLKITALPTDVKDRMTSAPLNFSLRQNYPNPFNPVTTIRFSVAKNEHVSLTIYNILGQKVKTLIEGKISPGNYLTEWNGTDISDRAVTSGIYLIALKSGSVFLKRKIILLK